MLRSPRATILVIALLCSREVAAAEWAHEPRWHYGLLYTGPDGRIRMGSEYTFLGMIGLGNLPQYPLAAARRPAPRGEACPCPICLAGQ